MERLRRTALLAALGCMPALAGCVTLAEFDKLEHEVAVLKQGRGPAGRQNQTMADLTVEIEELRAQLASLEGRVDEAEHRAENALSEARAARQEASGGGPLGAAPAPGTVPGSAPGPDAGGRTPQAPASVDPSTLPEGAAGQPVAADEVQAYREAYAAWRAGDTQACIDRFQQFLQTHASSAYADDAAFWMADCYFKRGDYQLAILRFDDVPRMYPTGNKAADALYRQGEALIRLGPSYAKAARRAFERVVQEYPDSPRVPAAKRQLEALRTG
jgi:tol-pal system protein YbgF